MDTQETQKRKYKKHKTDIKITVKHYINKKISLPGVNGEIHNPLYVQVMAKQKMTFFKSRINTLDAPTESLERWIHQEGGLKRRIDREQENIITLTRELIELKKEEFSIKDLSKAYRQGLKGFFQHLNFCLQDIICTRYHDQYESSKDIAQDDLNGAILDVAPLILLDKWKNIPEIAEIRNLYKSEIWYLDYYNEYLKDVDNMESFVYSLLEPTMIDYRNGHLKDEFLRLFDNKPGVMKDIFDEVDDILNRYSPYEKPYALF